MESSRLIFYLISIFLWVCPVFSSSMLQTVSEWLWWERLWLPRNVSWSDLEDSEGRIYAKAFQLFAALPCALCLLLVRYLFERWEYKLRDQMHPCVIEFSNVHLVSEYCYLCYAVGHTYSTFTLMLIMCCRRNLATPLANVWGIRDSVRRKAEPNPILENYFCSQAQVPSQVCWHCPLEGKLI